MPEHPTLTLDALADPTADLERGSVLFVGTATVIMRICGFTILTDPNFLHAGDHVHLGYGLTSERLTEPAFGIEDLPPVDFCILSHYHGDHFDQLVEERLRKDLPIITTEHAADELKEKGFTATIALDTWDSVTVQGAEARVRITSMPGQHGPGIIDFALPPVMGSMLDFENASGKRTLRVYISGDTLIHGDLNEIPKRFPDVNLALLHLGGTRVLGVLVTMDDEQGVEMMRIIEPRTAIPIHYNDYDVFKSPLKDFKKAAERAGFSDRIVYLAHGESYEFETVGSQQARGRGSS
ncbi:MAG TPA: MBL fold metallo-hydrolase [Pyrinomonadaceae bacterium]|nr:MBL fold metallo-hydrolase [Pyrinomonadaceae bacterium]